MFDFKNKIICAPMAGVSDHPFRVMARKFGADLCVSEMISSVAMHYAKILASLKIKNGISLTPLNCDLNAFTFALNDSADAFVERLSK